MNFILRHRVFASLLTGCVLLTVVAVVILNWAVLVAAMLR